MFKISGVCMKGPNFLVVNNKNTHWTKTIKRETGYENLTGLHLLGLRRHVGQLMLPDVSEHHCHFQTLKSMPSKRQVGIVSASFLLNASCVSPQRRALSEITSPKTELLRTTGIIYILHVIVMSPIVITIL
jgi:hypothetical protein